MKTLLAIDLGASNGRGILGRFDGAKLTLEEVKRFGNASVNADGFTKWDVLALYANTLRALKEALSRCGRIDSVGIDAWGLDVGLLDEYDMLLSNPNHYISALTEDELPALDGCIDPLALYRRTGIQHSRLKTLVQLSAYRRKMPAYLSRARTMLFIPNLIASFLTGEKVNEGTVASTSQMLQAGALAWDRELLERVGIDPDLPAPLRMGGSGLTPMRDSVAREVGGQVPVALTYAHDTACAFLAAPLRRNETAAILSCGTRGLLGMELDACILTEEAYRAQFSNEIGADGTVRFLQSVSGLWTFQQLCAEFAQEPGYETFQACAQRAENARPFSFLVNLDHEMILGEGTMSQKLAAYCRKTGQRPPEGRGELLRSVLESLALSYARITGQMERCTGKTLERIHVLGGGGHIRLLMQCVADAAGKPVTVGPYEASAYGNLYGQLMSCGECGNRWEAREITGRSCSFEEYEPRCNDRWKGAMEQFLQTMERE